MEESTNKQTQTDFCGLRALLKPSQVNFCCCYKIVHSNNFYFWCQVGEKKLKNKMPMFPKLCCADLFARTKVAALQPAFAFVLHCKRRKHKTEDHQHFHCNRRPEN